MGDKDLSQSVDDFFDIRSLAAVLLGFAFIEWIKVLLVLAVGSNPMTMAIVWPILFILFVIITANAGKKTNHDLKYQEFRDEIAELKEEQDDE